MKFSVIVPIYNTENYLQKCIESIIAQSYSDYEIILVDDGSKKECAELCDKYSENEKIIVIHKTNGGLVSARKTGSMYATGDYIINVDSDDYIRDDYLQTMHDVIENSNTECVAFNYLQFNENETTETKNAFAEGLYAGEELKTIKEKYLYNKEERRMNNGSLIFGVVAKVVKADIYKKVQESIPNEISIGEDTAFTFVLLNSLNDIFLSNYNGYYYRQNNNSLTHTVSMKEIEGISCLVTFLSYNDTENIYSNQIYTYTIMRVVNLFTLLAKSSELTQFVENARKDLPEIIKTSFRRVKVYRWGWGFFIKYFCIKHRLIKLFYYLSKMK